MILVHVLWFAFANWLAGGNLSWRKRFGLPGRSIYYAALLTMIVGWFVHGWAGVAVGVNFLLWRLPGWYGAIDSGLMPAATPGQSRLLWLDMSAHMRLRDFIVMSSRGLLAFPLFAWWAWARGDVLEPALVLTGVSLWQGLAYEAAHRYGDRDNGKAEMLAGAGWGAAYYALLA